MSWETNPDGNRECSSAAASKHLLHVAKDSGFLMLTSERSKGAVPFINFPVGISQNVGFKSAQTIQILLSQLHLLKMGGGFLDRTQCIKWTLPGREKFMQIFQRCGRSRGAVFTRKCTRAWYSRNDKLRPSYNETVQCTRVELYFSWLYSGLVYHR